MRRQPVNKVGIILKGASPTAEEQAIIDSANFAKKVYANGRFVVCNSSERMNVSKVLNLSGRKDIDDFYRDILIDISSFLEEVKNKAEKIKNKMEDISGEYEDKLVKPADKAPLEAEPEKEKEKDIKKEKPKKAKKKD